MENLLSIEINNIDVLLTDKLLFDDDVGKFAGWKVGLVVPTVVLVAVDS